MKSSYPQPDALCPACGYHYTHASIAIGKSGPPVSGDLVLCWNCGALLEYDDDLSLMRISLKAVIDLSPAQVLDVANAQREIKKRGPIEPKEKPS